MSVALLFKSGLDSHIISYNLSFLVYKAEILLIDSLKVALHLLYFRLQAHYKASVSTFITKCQKALVA